MEKEKKTHAILFADIAQSTRLYEQHGDTLSQRIITDCFAALNQVISDHHGRLIKTIGDEIMCVFPTARDAVEAARQMPTAVEQVSMPNTPGSSAPPSLYIGIHYGSVIVDQGDIFGDAVNVAARMVSLAKQHQIIVTQNLVDALPLEFRNCIRCIDKMQIKGKTQDMLIYEVLCELDSVTLMLRPSTGKKRTTAGKLELRVGKTIIEVNEANPTKTLGRQSQNDIVINDHRVSRSHARIEHRRGKFFLIDQSTNGTYVQRNGFDQILLRRDEMLLEGSGCIGLYEEVTALSSNAIHYSVKAPRDEGRITSELEGYEQI